MSSLNSQQLKAVSTTEGNVLVFAGAGSGKTRVLITRIAALLKQDVRPYNILAITFTNKAAAEMKERLANITPHVRDIWVSTIHSMCVRMLRADGDKIGYSKDFSIYSETEKDRVLKRIIKAMEISDEKILKKVKWHIGNSKTINQTPDQYVEQGNLLQTDVCYKIMLAYESELKQSNALDFDDLLTKTHALLKTCPETREKYSSKFHYIHVDEFQDTSILQYEIIKMLSSVHGNLFCVGDDDQSIYSWRGAHIDNILNFGKEMQNAQIIKLEQNYRSTQSILSVANAVIGNNEIRANKTLFSDGDKGLKPELFTLYDEKSEAERVVSIIKELQREFGYKNSDFAILYRLNSISRSFEQALTSYNMPFKVFGGFKFFDRKEVKDLISYLRLIVNPSDAEALRRIINVPKRGIGDTTIAKLQTGAEIAQTSLFASLKEAELVSGKIKEKVKNFYQTIVDLQDLQLTMPLSEFIKKVIEETNFMLAFDMTKEDDKNKRANVEEFASQIVEFEKENPEADLSEFLQSVTLSSEADEDETEFITLSTVHAAKGLEYKIVFIVGFEEGVFPLNRGDEDEIEEERRLCYVAVTRARERLYLTLANSRFSFTHGRENTLRSRFIKEMGETIRMQKRESDDDFETKPVFKGSFTAGADSFRGSYGMPKTSPQSQNVGGGNGYAVGEKVNHKIFGEGVVTKVSGSGAGESVDVKFDKVGNKTLITKFAPLTKI
ncbi:MAG: UvrD-helicase domain-containing protein [Bacillota bacterium]